MDKYFYDVESFCNLFTVTFLSESDGSGYQFVIGCGRNDLNNLLGFLNREILLIGFNSISYDDPVIRYIQTWDKKGNLPEQIFKLSGRLVSDLTRRDADILALRYPRGKNFSWKSLDLLKIMAFDRMGVSLKQIAINLKHDLILDSPFGYGHEILNDDEVSEVLAYNLNDVEITKKLYYAIQPQIKLRDEIGKLYGVDVTNASDSKMGNIILEHFYEAELGVDVRGLRDLRTKREVVSLKDCIPHVIHFDSKELSDLRDSIWNTDVSSYNNFKFEQKIDFRGTRYSIGSGGIHSMEGACRFDTDSTKKIISCDIASMYPSCIIMNNIYPKHLGEDFVKVLATLTAERLNAKKTNKVKADALKITVNGLYGKLNSDTFWLEDALAMLRVTIAGQLYILMLIEMLENSGIHCISANTDGIECEVSVEKVNTYHRICSEWEKKTGFSLEFTTYKSYIKRDVNNYIAITEDGKVKTKGAFIQDIELKKGYKHPIVPKAVNEYFVHGIPVEKTISECKDIFDFCISQKSGADFGMELHTVTGIQLLQKTNRFYISNKGGSLQKRRHFGKGTIGLFVGQNIRLLNSYNPETSFEDYDVDIAWYVREAKSLIDEIEPKQMQLGMFTGVADYGKKTFMTKDGLSEKESKKSVKKKPKEKDIREANKTRNVFNVSPKYMLVTNVDTTYSPVVEMYSLSKGTGKHYLKIRKAIFEKHPIKLGDVLYLKRMEQEPKKKKVGNEFVDVKDEFVWWLYEYSIISDFSNFEWKG